MLAGPERASEVVGERADDESRLAALGVSTTGPESRVLPSRG